MTRLFLGGPYGKIPGTDIDFGWGGVSTRQRSPEEVARIKVEKRRAYEDAILAEADAIRARRARSAATDEVTRPRLSEMALGSPEGGAAVLEAPTGDIVEIAGKPGQAPKRFLIERVYLDGPDQPPFYGCGILPLRRDRDDLIRDIAQSQGPEWRR